MSATASESKSIKIKASEPAFFEEKSLFKFRDKALMNALMKVKRNGKELGEEYNHLGIVMIASHMLVAMETAVNAMETGEIGGPSVNFKKR